MQSFMSRNPGIIFNICVEVLAKEHANSGTIFVDHASDFILTFTQTSTRSNQEVEAKHKFETFSKSYNTSTRHYHDDDRILNSQIFKETCITNKQTWYFCGVNAHHQNRIAENKIRSVVSLSRALLFNTMIKWPPVAHLCCWPFVVYCSVEILNNTLKLCGFAPKEMFTGVKGYRKVKHCHALGSSACVLDKALQTGKIFIIGSLI